MVKKIGTAGFNVGTNKVKSGLNNGTNRVGHAVKKIPFSKMIQAGKDAKTKIKSQVKEKIHLRKKHNNNGDAGGHEEHFNFSDGDENDPKEHAYTSLRSQS